MGHVLTPAITPGTPSQDDEIIPTAIVIKNIPFAVKKEQLVQLMTDMGLPLPYAFNYHFDNGIFRGLALLGVLVAPVAGLLRFRCILGELEREREFGLIATRFTSS